LRDIQNLGCSKEFRLLDFGESSYRNQQNKKQPEYLMTKDGFTLLVMGYTGKKAMAFKEAYIDRFNEMENFIKTLTTARLEYPQFTSFLYFLYVPCNYQRSRKTALQRAFLTLFAFFVFFVSISE
jgi:hypothetical protein